MKNIENSTKTKHEQILEHIESLEIGTKISVRQIAKDLEVSEGTAYRAIKDAEIQGLVSTKERIGTIRIEKKNRMNIDQLTFADVVKIVDGSVLGGAQGLDKPLNKFVIGAMKLEAMMRYVDPDSLLIVGNRDEVHKIALEHGAGVLITGGFDARKDVKNIADQKELPLISSSYDSFTVASMINRAIYDRLIKKKIMLVEDMIYVKKSDVFVLKCNHTVKDMQEIAETSGHSRFPIVDEWNRVTGMITSKDMIGADKNQTLDKYMTRNPITVNLQTSITSAAHMMVWEGIELLPVVDHHRKLLGVISRKDVLHALQHLQKQPQMGETFENLIWSGFEQEHGVNGELQFHGEITPQMTSQLGTVSEGVLTTLMTKAAYQAIGEVKKGDYVLDNISTYFVRPLQIDSKIKISPGIIEVSRKFAKVEVQIFHEVDLICKAMLTAQIIDS
ncbi:DRTGG domain-containing protein [Chengkuizengella axinellae]|uniref:DRTGG domain-containing protein n=1 Tax=Chengkuizengella axinellae TaxID=3064388 RepID=A0ABT9IYG3_9BACL|nr:DRTGG domain-containing protein [Chengkuizengella sp. 2205SS18-9]MDP5274404.1 DRTGG domain-containing protein [Chengkuizengella sp. 2205SS18-9]